MPLLLGNYSQHLTWTCGNTNFFNQLKFMKMLKNGVKIEEIPKLMIQTSIASRDLMIPCAPTSNRPALSSVAHRHYPPLQQVQTSMIGFVKLMELSLLHKAMWALVLWLKKTPKECFRELFFGYSEGIAKFLPIKGCVISCCQQVIQVLLNSDNSELGLIISDYNHILDFRVDIIIKWVRMPAIIAATLVRASINHLCFQMWDEVSIFLLNFYL